MKRITLLAAAGALVATPALGGWAALAAADDGRSAPNVRVDHGERHSARHSGEAERGDGHGRGHRHGTDDARHARHSAQPERADDHGRQADDDPVGHVRHGEPEPGDDRGGAAEPEVGDDHTGHAELEPRDDHGGDLSSHSGSGRDDSGRDDSGRDDSGSHGGHHGGDDD
jgi:hypothetical protein